ncbi:major facilitator superfamily domain-containing protein [Kockovaella imperatae]|uniref:Major facilitator superfamily domain-containing protein n=1 Tax=Kockovaella imperatae TaxID=4999 RepID=A0A1Y1UJT0_9TREE|nr:major facilitator superfamily domain-containing protein [Kockovaella imperatae]ORX38239.1 major facilitator superfamily domain-containing protein [Kockovaella imperatae]
MTGGGYIPTGPEDFELEERGQSSSSTSHHAVQWIGKPSVKGPKWARLPLLTVGMLGIQCVWSIEMGYASPFLLDLGLSKSYMSLVFMAGPLSGLIVQPLVGAFADRSRSRWGRRRPFMIAGCTICVFAMMLLGWSREVAALFGFGNWMAIFLAVSSIYMIDFSINAVMSTDRALIVDSLPPKEQEEGSAWGGRMNGFGGLAGFFVGNLDLPPVLPFLGKTQLQILSFITSAILMTAHFFTSWAVTERVLLRDDRPQKNGLFSNLRAIWDNLFALPPGIKTVCTIQFFASLGWYPVLFFTTIWVTEVYKASHPELDPSDPDVGAAAVRAGARALFCQAVVNIICAMTIPILVESSGVLPSDQRLEYEALNGNGQTLDQPSTPGSATWKRMQEERGASGRLRLAISWIRDVFDRARSGQGVFPLKGLTLMKVWVAAQAWFALAMLGSWFVTSPFGAYLVIGSTGFSWALFQWAPFCLLGELILLEGNVDRSGPRSKYDRRPGSPRDDYDPEESPTPLHASVIPESISIVRPAPQHPHPHNSSQISPRESQPSSSRPSLSDDHVTSARSRRSRPSSLDLKLNTPAMDTSGDGLTPLIHQNDTVGIDHTETSIVIHHGDSSDSDSESDASPYRPSSPRSPIPGQAGNEIGDKAGIILGIHNLFLVCPQFLVTFLSSIIFALMEDSNPLPTHHPNSNPVLGINGTGLDSGMVADPAGLGFDEDGLVRDLSRRAEAIGTDESSPAAVGLIFRIGGVSAAIGAFICWRLMRQFARGEGI